MHKPLKILSILILLLTVSCGHRNEALRITVDKMWTKTKNEKHQPLIYNELTFIFVLPQEKQKSSQ